MNPVPDGQFEGEGHHQIDPPEAKDHIGEQRQNQTTFKEFYI